MSAEPADGEVRELCGVPVAPGVVEGEVRVVLDPAEAHGLEPAGRSPRVSVR